ncbi:MAG: hypothetical protein P4L33_04825 [Capsulimonadaceae bacterium]|nr:hypothetical protein [Capsulimonadaceae bacterium]
MKLGYFWVLAGIGAVALGAPLASNAAPHRHASSRAANKTSGSVPPATPILHGPLDSAHGYYYRLRARERASDGSGLANAVILGGEIIMRFRVGDGGFTPIERAEETQDRLNALLGGGPIYPEDISTRPFGDDAIVQVNGQLLFTADPVTAAINSSTPMQLANNWASKMRDILPDLTAPH